MAEFLIPRTGGDAPLTMTSREIAELTGKEHKNVLADIRTMLGQLEMHSADFSAKYQDSTGRMLPCFALPKDLTITLVSGYSAPLRHRIVTRWLELERSQQPAADPVQVLNDPAALRSLLLGYNEKVLELQPKADALDRLSKLPGSVTLREAAAMEQVAERWFTDWLHQKGWIYKPGRYWAAYAEPRKAGYLEMPARKWRDADTGEERLSYRVRVTPRGLAKIAEMLAKESFVPRTQPELV